LRKTEGANTITADINQSLSSSNFRKGKTMHNSFSTFVPLALLCALLALPVVSAQNKPAGATNSSNDDARLRERAMKLQRASLVVDTHNDITSYITDEGFD